MSDDFTAQGRFDCTDERAVIPLNPAKQGFGQWSKEDMWLRDIVSEEMVILVLTNERSWKEKDALEGNTFFLGTYREVWHDLSSSTSGMRRRQPSFRPNACLQGLQYVGKHT